MKRLVMVVTQLIVTLVVLEVTARFFGYAPWEPPRSNSSSGWYAPDPELGWVRTSIHKSSLASSNSSLSPTVVVTGGSFTEGAGIAPEDTFSALLAQRFSHESFVNYGTGAYGTYQSFLSFRRHLKDHQAPKLVIYGFVDFHEYRNVAYWQWLKGLAWKNTTGTVAIPYCHTKSGALTCFPPRNYPNFPLRKYFALVDLAEEVTVRLPDSNVLESTPEVTMEILKLFSREAEQHGSSFLVAYIASVNRPPDFYEQRFKDSGLSFVRCLHPEAHTPAYTLPSDGHPNERLNAFWANCIGDHLGLTVLSQVGTRK